MHDRRAPDAAPAAAALAAPGAGTRPASGAPRATRTAISIVVPTLDAGPGFAHLCAHLARLRDELDVEVLIIDSGSTDGTAERAEAAGLHLHRIRREEFGHGRTRNLGVRLTAGDVVCFLTQDVLPCTPDWPARFAAALRDPRVAGVYGRQIPRDATTMEMFFVALNYPAEPLRFDPAPRRQHPRPGRVLFSNAFSAVRRDVALRIPFADDVPVSEDQVWAYKVLAAGHSIAYEPAAEALHAHRYSLRGLFRRTRLIGRALRTAGIDGGASFTESVRFLATELRYFVAQGHTHRLPQLLAYEFVRWAGFQVGRRGGRGANARRPQCSGAAANQGGSPDGLLRTAARLLEPDRCIAGITRRLWRRHRGRQFIIEVLRQRCAWWYSGRRNRWTIITDFDDDLIIRLDRSAFMGSSIYWYGHHAGGEIRLLKQILKPEMVFVDVGANQGEFTLCAAKRLPAGRVLSFEPYSQVYQQLIDNIALNGFDNVTTYRLALSDKTGVASIMIPSGIQPDRSFNEGLASLFAHRDGHVMVETVTMNLLDRVLQENPIHRVDVVKLDVEGAELSVLRGAKLTLARHRPAIITEIHEAAFHAAGYGYEEFLGLLGGCGYEFYLIDDDGETAEIGRHALPSFGNLLCLPR